MADELVEIADDLARQLRECQAFAVGWLIKAGEILRDYQGQLPRGDMTAIYGSGRLPLGQRYGQMLSAIARNKALRNSVLLQSLPSTITALAALAPVDPKLIEQGVRDATLHRRLTRQGAMAIARKLRTQALLTPTTSTPTLI